MSLPDPRNVREAMAAHDAGGWKEAVDKNMANLKSYDVHELVPRVKGLRTPIPHTRLGLRRKIKNGIFVKNKAKSAVRDKYQRLGLTTGNQFHQ